MRSANAARRWDGFKSWLPREAQVRPEVIASSEALGWDGADMQIGHNFGCDLEDVYIDGHFIGVHMSDSPLDVAYKNNDEWKSITQPPNCIYIQPKGAPLSIRHHSSSRWAGLIVRSEALDRAMGSARELSGRSCLFDDMLSHLILSLVEQLSHEDLEIRHNKLLSQNLINSLLVAIGLKYSSPSALKGGISDFTLRKLRKWIDAHLAEPLTVSAMAEVANLSVSHFAREFRKSTGLTPWTYVRRARLERARTLIESGERAGEVVRMCGFADQAHLSRGMKAHFGLTPSAVKRLGRTEQLGASITQ